MAGDERTRLAILRGDFDYLPGEERCSVKVFLCADPLDSEWERAALHVDVYPKLREYCRHTYGLEFQVIDGYDGVHLNDRNSNKMSKVRMQLLEECIETSAGTCFVALIGEEYGESCLPTQIYSEEFEKILHTAEKHGLSTKILESCYQRDENGIPPVYNLLDMDEPSQYSRRQRGDYSDRMYEASQEIKRIFDTAVPLCLKKGILREDEARKYFSSALEDELLFVLQNQPEDVLERCVCYIHKVPFKAYQKQKGRSDPPEGGLFDGYSRLCHLRDTLIPTLAQKGGLHVYTTTTTCDIKVGYTREKRQQYVEGLCKQFYGDMVKLIDSQVRRPRKPLKNGLEDILEHLSLCAMYSGLQQYEPREAEAIKHYILEDGSQRPMVVAGESGCGKTVLLASCAKKVRLWLTDCDPILVVRFIPSSGEAFTLFRLLAGLCQQLSDIYMTPVPLYRGNIGKLVECFHNLLSVTTKERPLVLIVDGIDNLTHCKCNNDIFWWLPAPLPLFSKIIVSVSHETFLNLNKAPISKEVLLSEVKPVRKECNDQLRLNLLKEHRRITSGQQIYVNQSLTSSTSPLQMRLIFKEVLGWKSHQDTDDQSLGQSIHESAERLFYKLEMKYGYELVSRTLSYLTLSKSGIGEAELVDLLSSDNTILDQLFHIHDNVSILRVPDWLVASILLDLKCCIASRFFSGYGLIYWTNKLFQQVVAKRYLSKPELTKSLHANMCDYFSGRWAGGRAKSISVKAKPSLQSEKLPPKSISNEPSKIYVDCRLPSQPWYFAGNYGGEHRYNGNLRKAFDLPYHLKECGKLEAVYNDVLMSLPYYKILLNSGHLSSLICSIEDIARQTGREEVNLICDMIQESRCLLIDNPNAFELIVQSKMVPLLPLYPCLYRFTKQIFCESIKSTSLLILNSGLFRLPSMTIEFQEPSRIVSILDTKTNLHLIVVFKNGQVYTWRKAKETTLEHRISLGLEITNATLEDENPYLVLSTIKQSIILLDCSSWTILNEIGNELKETVLTLKGYHLSKTIFYVLVENAQQVRMLNVLSGEIIKELSFAQRVTYFSCIDGGQYLVVGQSNTLQLYSTEDVSKAIILQMDTSKHIICDVYVHESSVVVIDKNGTIRLWNTMDSCKPQLLDELYSTEEGDEVVSTELATEQLLVCRSNSFDVWQTTKWEMVSFHSLYKDPFISCMFSQYGDAVIAAVHNVPSLFIWSIKSGQLISMINLESQVTLLTKSLKLHLLGAVTQSKSVILWDLKSITISTASSQTGRPFSSLILCPLGDSAYTSDGSDIVCKWNIPTCSLSAFFRHRNIVQMIKGTPNGDLLITSVTTGEIYVWETDSGINQFCIRSSPVSQILVTPNSNIVVTLCENGGSRVWRSSTGLAVCKIRTFVSQAIVSPEGTFVIGLSNNNRLLAISLWSGCVSKEFCCPDESGSIVAFQCLSSYMDFVVLLTSCADIYTWNVVEETFCLQTKLSIQLSLPVPWFHISYDGNIIVISGERTINVISILDKKCYTLHTPNSILHQHLTNDGKYLIYICHGQPNICTCDFHVNPVLNVVEVFNGRTIAQCHLGKMPCTMMVSDDEAVVCVGFEDGTLGSYSVARKWIGNARLEGFLSFNNKEETIDCEVVNIYQSKSSVNILWSDDSTNCDLSPACSSDEETVLG